MFNKILLICIGNICRSPMAAALLAHNLAGQNVAAKIESAGLGALVGNPADPIAQELMAERGIDISNHRARQLTTEMLTEFELILTMESDQVKAIETMHPQSRGRVHRLGKWSDFEVPDPYRRPRSAFEKSLELIEQGLKEWQQKLWN